jgi:hypothetical protein
MRNEPQTERWCDWSREIGAATPLAYARTMADLSNEMLWSDDAPSSVAEDILRRYHRPTILPAPRSADRSQKRFEHHLKANGVGEHFSVNEITTPNHVDIASQAGWVDLTPPAFTWGVSCLLVWMADRMRQAANSPVSMRNYWRPQSYNSRVASSGIESDHPNACGLDLDFSSAGARSNAQDWLRDFVSSTENVARVSVGLGGQSIHVGVLSPSASRYWTYDSYNEAVPDEFTRMADMPFRISC